MEEHCETPKFNEMLGVLKSKINENGVSKESEQNLKLSRKNLEEKRRKFMPSQILYKIISDISMDVNCPVQDEVAKILTLAELSGCIDLGSTDVRRGDTPAEKITTLALDPSLFERPETSVQIQKVLKQNIEGRLFDSLKSLYIITNHQESDSDLGLKASLIHPHLVRLHEKITEIVIEVKESNKEMKFLNMNLDEALRKQTNILGKMETDLDQLINKHYKGSKLESTSVQVQYMRAKCETLRLKIKCLEMEIINSTYNKESIKAIKLVRTRLLEKIQKRESDLTDLENRIAQYRGVSTEFSDVVKQFAKILKQIEEKKWALRELNSAPPAL